MDEGLDVEVLQLLASVEEIELDDNGLSAESLLFGETPSRIVISFAPENAERVREIVGDLPFQLIGKVAGERLIIKASGEEKISASVAELETAWKRSLEKQLEG